MKKIILIFSYLIPILLIISGLVLAVPAFSSLVESTETMACYCPSCEEMDFANKGAQSLGLIKVDLAGAVKKPGVYQLEIGQRIADLIEKADGFTDDVSKDFLAKELNLASELENAAKIYIPFEGELVATTNSAVIEGAKISINTASTEELETLSGVGEKRAEDLIGNRPYSQLIELVDKNVFSQSLFESLEKELSL
jgi:DNA uptake protein ComE-like DNA-binding protein